MPRLAVIFDQTNRTRIRYENKKVFLEFKVKSCLGTVWWPVGGIQYGSVGEFRIEEARPVLWKLRENQRLLLHKIRDEKKRKRCKKL